jgi:hypothetical protein
MSPAAKSILAVMFTVGASYAAYPYVTLYRLSQAVRTGDAAALQTLVDWPSVREGIKEDICDNVADDPAATVSGGKLPPFGASFVRGIAANAVDQRVTPEALVVMTQPPAPGPRAPQVARQESPMQVNWAFFDDPTHFTVSINALGQPASIRLEMRLKDAGWQVTRIWLPPALLAAANSRT